MSHGMLPDSEQSMWAAFLTWAGWVSVGRITNGAQIKSLRENMDTKFQAAEDMAILRDRNLNQKLDQMQGGK